jgi:hypothetical protein
MDPHARNVGVAFGTLLASTATLLCCALPAVLVSLGAGAVLVGMLSAFPQLVWLSEHKLVVFAVAGALLALSGVMIWRARWLPCPVDPIAARSCKRLRVISNVLFGFSLAAWIAGASFAFLFPWLQAYSAT